MATAITVATRLRRVASLRLPIRDTSNSANEALHQLRRELTRVIAAFRRFNGSTVQRQTAANHVPFRICSGTRTASSARRQPAPGGSRRCRTTPTWQSVDQRSSTRRAASRRNAIPQMPPTAFAAAFYTETLLAERSQLQRRAHISFGDLVDGVSYARMRGTGLSLVRVVGLVWTYPRFRVLRSSKD
jgi:hypothetical protein